MIANLFAVTAVVPTLTTFYFVNSQSSDARVIDIAGRQRMLAYKIAAEAKDLVFALESESSTGEIRSKLLESMSLFGQSLNALEKGGTTSGTNGVEVRLPGAAVEARHQLKEVQKMWMHYKNHLEVITDPKADITSDRFFEAADEITKDGPTLLSDFNVAAVLLKEASEGKTEVLKTVQVASLILTIIFATAFWFLADSSVVQPICQTSDIMDLVAQKNLTQSLSFGGAGEIGRLGRAVNSMIRSVGGLINQIAESSTIVASASQELSVTAEQIAQGSKQQSDKVYRVSTASQQASTTLVTVAKDVDTVVTVAEDANQVAIRGGELVTKSIEGIHVISNATNEISRAIKSLEIRSQEIGDIIKVINDIADQTNLLSLNAAIEAARAGERGKGFSVVAEEVRKLAEKTTKSTEAIKETVKAIQDETDGTLILVENEVKAVEEGVVLATKTGSGLEEILAHAKRVSSMIQQISVTAEEESGRITQISEDIDAVAEITKENSTASNSLAQTSQEIAKYAADLNTSIEQFSCPI